MIDEFLESFYAKLANLEKEIEQVENEPERMDKADMLALLWQQRADLLQQIEDFKTEC